MMIQEPQDIRGGPAPRRNAHGRDSFGPQGPELIRELRRIEGLLGRDATGFRPKRKPAAGQHAAETTAAATQAHPRMGRAGEPPADSITNILELPMGRLGRAQRRPAEPIAPGTSCRVRTSRRAEVRPAHGQAACAYEFADPC